MYVCRYKDIESVLYVSREAITVLPPHPIDFAFDSGPPFFCLPACLPDDGRTRSDPHGIIYKANKQLQAFTRRLVIVIMICDL